MQRSCNSSSIHIHLLILPSPHGDLRSPRPLWFSIDSCLFFYTLHLFFFITFSPWQYSSIWEASDLKRSHVKIDRALNYLVSRNIAGAAVGVLRNHQQFSSSESSLWLLNGFSTHAGLPLQLLRLHGADKKCY